MVNSLDVFRADTPGCDVLFEGRPRIHLDNCGASLQPRSTLEAVRAHINREAEVGGYVAEEEASARISSLYPKLAQAFGGHASDYAFTSSAVDAWVRAFYSVPIGEGDNVITASTEYCANYIAFMQQCGRRGAELRIWHAGPDGRFDLAELEALIDEKTRLISVTHVPSSSGQRLPASAVGAVARKYGVPYLLDACQSVGQLPISVDEIGCDMMTGTGRKFLRAPRGTGFLYVSEAMRERLDPVFLTNQSATWTGVDSCELRSDARIFEGWERGVAAQLGFVASLDYALQHGFDTLTARTQALAALLRSALKAEDRVFVECPLSADTAIITFNIDGILAQDVKRHMAERGVAVQVASRQHTFLDMSARAVETSVRVSPHYYNSEAELEVFLGHVRSLCG